MSVVILEGKITELSNATVTNGSLTQYEFINIGGKRVRKICVDNYLDSMIHVGAVVRLACSTSSGRHLVFAVQEENGEVAQADLGPLILTMMYMLICGGVIGAVASLFAYIFTQSIVMTTIAFAVVALGLPYLICSDPFKARKALRGMAAPVDAAVA